STWTTITGGSTQNYPEGPVSILTSYRRIVTSGPVPANTSNVITVTPISIPVVAFTNAPLCAGSGINLWATPIPGATYAWAGPNGYQANGNQVMLSNATAANSGIYTVTATLNGVSNSSTITTIVTTPNTLAPTGGGVYCVGSNIQLNANNGSYWRGPNNYFSLGAQATLSPATLNMAGVYTVFSNTPIGNNLIVNGDFESGNTGFTSQHTYNSDLLPPATYYIGSDPRIYNRFWSAACSDHTQSPGTQMMIINGSTQPNVAVWSQTVTVDPNSTYQFAFWLQNVHIASIANLQLFVDGIQVGEGINSPSGTCNWIKYAREFNTTNNTSVNISIRNQNLVFSGNDFAIDDIDLRKVCSSTATQTISIRQVNLTHTAVNPTAPGVNDGSIDITPSGGDAPYTYTWSNGATTEDITGLAAGTYLVTGRDVNGCIDTQLVVLTNRYPSIGDNVITASQTILSGTVPASFSGNLPSGGTGTYGYQWERST
ncbi:MAG: hypothetical protein EBX50_20735, partial [Chitinophagia bacterium]|nr:hypothetical protein [Chitinophagia bacterium]